MGTTWSARIVIPTRGLASDPADAVQAALDEVVAQMSGWEPQSHLSRFNRSSPGAWRGLPPEMIRVIAAALDVAEASGGAFDPAMGALVDLWGFGAAPASLTPPDAEFVDALLGQPGWRRIECDRPALQARRLGPARLDLSGIAKGFGVDQAAAALRAIGIRHFLVEVGGELLGSGLKPDGEPWWVDVELPPGARLATTRIALHDLAIATSGDYRRWFDHGGRRYAHSIDPRTGRPVMNRVASVSVFDAQCMRADAWATALIVLGEEQGMAVAEREGLAALFILRDRDGYRERFTSSLAAMLD